MHFFTQKQETHKTQQYYQLILLKEKILLKTKNPTQKILSIRNYYNKNVRCQWFGLQTVEETTNEQYFMEICFIVNYLIGNLFNSLAAFPSYDSYQLNEESFLRVFECVLCVLCYFYLSFTTYRSACLSDNSQIYFLPIKMNGNVASSPIKNKPSPVTMSMKIGCHTHGIFWMTNFDILAKRNNLIANVGFP